MTADPRLLHNLARPIAILAIIFFFSGGALRPSSALEPREYAIEVSAEVLNSPFRLRLSWEAPPFPRAYTIKRRVFGAMDWGSPIASLPAGTLQYVDNNVEEGAAYEYEIQLETTHRGAGGWVNAYGYILAGGKVSWPDQKGKVIVVVDDVAAASLGTEINLFLKDLIGAGWTPIRRDLTRTTSVPEVKNLIRAEYNADPTNVKSVILLGHVPVPYSGNIAPDLHESHRGAWPADVFYAEMDGNWTDSVVHIKSGDYAANDNWIGDGKYDQSQIPSAVELEIGRIDFYDLPAFVGRSQNDLLRLYLQKNTAFRHRSFTASRRVLIRDNFGDLSGDAPAVDAWRHYRQMFGAGAFREVGAGSFFPTLQNESFLWAYGCGGGGNTKADGVGTTTDFATRAPRSVFMILHGSYFGDWNTKDNFLRAAIAAEGYSLASIWSGLPHWFMHPMALGKNVGFTTRLTQNNVNTYRSHLNFAAQQVHISLIGDPTLECFPVIPPSNLSGTAPGNVELSWSASTDENIVGYHVYHSVSATGGYQRLTSAPVANTSYSHSVGAGTHQYMVRAVKLERTGSGTFFNLSQGIFATVTKSSGGTTPQINVGVIDGDAGETGPNNGAFRFMRSSADENPLRVDFLVGGTAEEGLDYNPIGTSITIPGAATEAVLTVVPKEDNLIEGAETVTIQIRSNASYTVGSSPSAVLTIVDGNKRPIAFPQTVSTMENEAVSIVLAGEDPEGQPLTFEIHVPPSNGTISGTPPEIIYTARSNYFGTDVFSFTVSDGRLDSAPAEVSLQIEEQNRAPLALPAEVSLLEDTVAMLNLLGTDPNGDPLLYELLTFPTNGILTETTNGRYDYRPATNFSGFDSFTFRAFDGELYSAAATIDITVIGTNDVPLVQWQEYSALEDETVEILLAVMDPDGDTLTYVMLESPTNGVLSGVGPALVYSGHSNFFGVDGFSYVVSDGTATSGVGRVMLRIEPVNDPPVAQMIASETQEDAPLAFQLSATDVEGDSLNYLLLTSPKNGSLSGTPPDLVYSAFTNFHGMDSFDYAVTDGASTSKVATVSISVVSSNDPPVIGALLDVSLRKNAFAGPLLLELWDVDTPSNELQLWAETTNEELIPTNRITFTEGDTNRQVMIWPNNGATGAAEITVRVSDGLASAFSRFVLTVTNTPPTARDDQFVEPAEMLVIPASRLLANDFDLDQEQLRLVEVRPSAMGKSVVLTNESVIYFGGTTAIQDSFRYEVEDGSGGRASATVWLTLTEGARITSLDVIDGNVRLEVIGKPNADFEVLSTADGVSWEIRGTGHSDEIGKGEFIDSGGASKHHRFYRAQWR